jgi:hypothetical protein
MGLMCIYMSSCVVANYESAMKLPMQRSCQRLIYAWAAELESELHFTVLRR